MSIQKRIGVIAGIALLTGMLSGCGPQSVADGELDWSYDWTANPGEAAPAFWEEPDRLVLILGGSSSWIAPGLLEALYPREDESYDEAVSE